jgi:hypothetical protein
MVNPVVRGVMMLPVETQAATDIFLDLEPTPLYLPDVEELASRPDFQAEDLRLGVCSAWASLLRAFIVRNHALVKIGVAFQLR